MCEESGAERKAKSMRRAGFSLTSNLMETAAVGLSARGQLKMQKPQANAPKTNFARERLDECFACLHSAGRSVARAFRLVTRFRQRWPRLMISWAADIEDNSALSRKFKFQESKPSKHRLNTVERAPVGGSYGVACRCCRCRDVGGGSHSVRRVGSRWWCAIA